MNIDVTRNHDYPYDEVEGFLKIDEIEWRNESYVFDITGVWVRLSDGTVWMAHDSGCSCPTPWENLNTFERVFSVDQLDDIYRDQNMEGSYGHTNYDEYQSFKATVASALEGLKERQ